MPEGLVKPSQRFCLAAPRKTFYFVEIYPSEKTMYTAVKRLSGKCSKNILALCLRYSCSHKYNGFTNLGTIFLQEKHKLNNAIVVHELTHAAIGYCNFAKLRPTQRKPSQNSDEEKFAELMGSLVEQYQSKVQT